MTFSSQHSRPPQQQHRSDQAIQPIRLFPAKLATTNVSACFRAWILVQDPKISATLPQAVAASRAETATMSKPETAFPRNGTVPRANYRTVQNVAISRGPTSDGVTSRTRSRKRPLRGARIAVDSYETSALV